MEIMIKEVLEKIKDNIKRKKQGAREAGLRGDQGASKLEQQINFFKAGIRFNEVGDIPEEWKKYVDQIKNERKQEELGVEIDNSEVKKKHWHIRLDDGFAIPFWYNEDGNCNPLEKFEDFDKGKYWSLDIDNQVGVRKYNFKRDSKDPTLLLVPKDKIIEVFYKE
jgi:hypothetical protein